MKITRYVAVIGASVSTSQNLKDAFVVGELLAKKGAIVVCGGLSGVMDAAAENQLLPNPGRSRRNPLLAFLSTEALKAEAD